MIIKKFKLTSKKQLSYNIRHKLPKIGFKQFSNSENLNKKKISFMFPGQVRLKVKIKNL